uniref:LIM zinc-binding domain-containing protein n=1 Tax=Clastoptera arizonana TaxID=38151 RepID=A0A1B6D845_9HEMI
MARYNKQLSPSRRSPRTDARSPERSLYRTQEKLESSDLRNSCLLDTICAGCRQPIKDVIVQALNKSWHQEHFVCTHCKKPITASKFNVNDGLPYCENDYTNLILKKCFKCDQPIRDVVIVAGNKTWHKEHFVCSSCNQPLSNKSFYQENEQPLCQNCYEHLICPKCSECNHPITDTAIIAMGMKYHQTCFRCKKCKKTISNCTFEMVNKQRICSNCVQNFLNS